jgi:SAM-dependent methyltransferase
MPFRPFDALRWSVPALHVQAVWRRWRRARQQPGGTPGACAVCDGQAHFVHVVDNPREDPLCRRCGSVPRHRALLRVLHELGIDLARATVHEASPSLGTWRFLRARCRDFTASMWLPGVRHGSRVGNFRHVDLQRQPFADATFDLVITQDVLEHVPDPTAALREIHRTLRPGGHHVFTVPRQQGQPTRARAEWRGGVLHHLAPAEYHLDPSTRAGTLVVTDWGMDLEALVADRGAASCAVHRVCDPHAGIPAPIEVFVARTQP